MAEREIYRLEVNVGIDGDEKTKKKLSAMDKYAEKSEKRMKQLDKIEASPAVKLKDKLSSPLKKMDGRISSFAKTAVKRFAAIATAGALLVGGLGIKDTMTTFMDFEQGLSSVQAVSQATAGEMRQLKDEAKRLGAETAWSAVQVTEAETLLAQAGFSVQENLSALPGLLSLASAGGVELSEATDIAAGTLKAFGLDASQAGHLADVFAVAASSTNSDVLGLGEAMKYVGPAAKAMGVSVEETTAAIGLLANANIKGSQAGTTLRSAFTRLAKPTDAASSLMKELGFNAFDAQGKMLPLDQVVGNLEKSTSGLTDQQKASAMATIFGQEAMSGMLALVEQGPEAFKELTDSLHDSEGAAEEMANVRLDNLAGQLTILKSGLEGMKIELGERLAPYFKDFVSWLTPKIPIITDKIVDLVDRAKEFGTKAYPEFKKFIDGVKDFIPKIAKLAPVIAGVAAAIATIKIGNKVKDGISSFMELKGLFTATVKGAGGLGKAFSVLMGPIGWVALAIGAAVAIGVLLYKNWDTIKEKAGQLKNWISDSWNGIKESTAEAWDNVKTSVSEKWNSLKDTITGIGPAIKEGVSNTWESVKTGTADKWNSIKETVSSAANSTKESVTNAWSDLKTNAVNKWDDLKEGTIQKLTEMVSFIQDKLLSLPDSILEPLQRLGDSIRGMMDGVKQIFSGAWEVIKNIFLGALLIIIDIVTLDFEKLGTDVAQIWGNIKEGFSQIWDGIKEVFINALEVIKAYADIIWNGIKETIMLVWTTVTEWLSGVWESIKTTAIEAWGSLKESIIAVVTATAEWIRETWNSIVEWFSALPERLYAKGTAMFNSLKEGAVTAINIASEWIKTTWDGIVEWFSTLPSRLYQKGVEIFTQLKEGLASMKESVSGKAKEIGDAIVEKVKNLPGEMLSMGKDIVQGLINGIGEKIGTLKTKAAEIGSAVSGKVRSILGIQSPSRVMMEVGEFTTEGMAIGMEKEIPRLEQATGRSYDVITSEEAKERKIMRPRFMDRVAERISSIKPFNPKSDNNDPEGGGPQVAVAGGGGTTYYINIDDIDVNVGDGGSGSDEDIHAIVEEAQDKFGKKLLKALKDKK